MDPISLAQLTVGAAGRVAAIVLETREVEWLRAVGISEGTRVTLLRRAPLGGPVHLRTGSGAEFAVDRELARSVMVEPGGADPGVEQAG